VLNIHPFNNPNLFKDMIAYSEQLGLYLHILCHGPGIN